MLDKKTVSDIIFGSQYYTMQDLRYNKKLGFLFPKEEMQEFIKIKEQLIDNLNDAIKVLPLKTFNSKHCFFVMGSYLEHLLEEYYSTAINDYEQNKTFLIDRNLSDILKSRLFSEIEGTLSIENVQTTHKRIKAIFENDNLKEKNDIIIKNMYNAMEWIMKNKPDFNKENLYKLYRLLSDNCLDDEDKLLDGNYYRHEDVFVGNYSGADSCKIDELMNSMFEFFKNARGQINELLVPHICHYYIVYVHPYFDYNGRTARMVSFWLYQLLDVSSPPLFISEAINECKKDYYEAIVNTRNFDNDLTYFLGYIFKIATKFSLIYKNVEEIKKQLTNKGEFLSTTEVLYVKKILVHNPEGFFNYKMFVEYINSQMTKQGALKILNNLADYDILTKTKNKKGELIYKVNPDYIKYSTENL